jgi:3'(2'), 5'-bisphosphate nucleotidase
MIATATPLTLSERRELLGRVRATAAKAALAVLEIYATDFAARYKADASPVTLADEAAEHVILADLAEVTPTIPVIAEEQVSRLGFPQRAPPRFWLVDPLDGTREFVHRNGEFTVNIALIENERPILGVVHVPARGEAYTGHGAATALYYRGEEAPRPIAARLEPPVGAVVVESRSHGDATRADIWLARLNSPARKQAGSSLKFCLIAAGEGDLYPRFGTTMEWDTAAGQAVLEAAGGQVTALDGEVLRYGKPEFRNPHFIARGLPLPPATSRDAG